MQTFTVQEAAAWLGKSPRTVRWMLTHGKLDGERAGKAWVIQRAALEAVAGGHAMAQREQVEKARDAVNDALDSLVPGSADEAAPAAKGYYSVTQLRAWAPIVDAAQRVYALRQQHSLHGEALDRVAARVREVACGLVDACHQYHPQVKVNRLVALRTRVCAAIAEARVEAELREIAGLVGVAELLERDTLRAVRGLLRRAEEQAAK